MQKLSVGLIGGGGVALVISVFLGWLALPSLIRSVIKKSGRLERGGETLRRWERPGDSIPVHLAVYFFNVSNPEEFGAGAKPRVSEIGPYVYEETRWKEDVELGETVVYRQKTRLHFLPHMSVGGQDDLVSFINIPFVAVAKMAATLSGNSAELLKDLDEDLVDAGERLFRTESVRKLLLDGFSVQNFLDLLNDPLTISLVGEVEIPKSFQGGKFAIYKGKNGSDDGLWEVKTGAESYVDFGQIVRWNNATELPWWRDASCNRLEGTDGTIFSPFLRPHHILKSFSPELCRSISMSFQQHVSFQDVPALRFSPVHETSLGVEKHPPNWCFCPHKDVSRCNRNGLMLLGPCKEGAPVALSNPHFYDADAAIMGGVEGLRPEHEKHKTFIDLEPSTGVMMRAKKRLQFNVDLTPNAAMSTFAKVRPVLFPVMWAEERMELPPEIMKLLKQVKHAEEKVETARWSMVGVSLACFSLGIFWVLSQRSSRSPNGVTSLTTKKY